MTRIFIVLLLLVAAASGTVAAQDNTTANETAPDLEDADTCDRLVEDGVRICSADFTDGESVLVFESDRRERITLTEAAPLDGADPNRDTFVLSSGRTEVRLSHANSASEGVWIDTGTTLTGVRTRTSDALLGGPWTVEDAQSAGIGAGLGTALMTLYLVARTVYGRDPTGERLA
ncbi:hypothetical protein GRS48_05500 [Halorubrum sp. JWXQ-INN 858]|uniref:hypothetical protein n=1 Tax=Halorubrum sp. JWXQ-INN 858 TaxID=2690782 RepID=UPI0013577767|nr:hypothetical protein [Halorubrum sp. JWXQ-INN 858]MWV64280.1 hypothetical protein [Halorubrum sp. JWXQ-INN 858]